MTKISWKPGTMLAPVPPALISCGTMEKPNVMTAAWTGIICTEPTLVYVSVRPSRYSNEIIRQTGEFVINVPTEALARAVDLCGVKSGRQADKFKLAGITPAACAKIKAPQVEEAPVSLECKVKEITSFGTHDMFLAEVVAVDVEEAYLAKDGALHLDKAGLLAYAHGFYYGLGKKIGKFGWSVEKASTVKKRAARMKKEKSMTASVKNSRKPLSKKKSVTKKKVVHGR